MTYVYWYLGIGALSFAVIFITQQLKKSPDNTHNNLWPSANPFSDNGGWELLHKVMNLILIFIVVMVIWPIIIYWEAGAIINARKVKEVIPPREFAVTRDHLLKHWSVGEIEMSELVSDPLEAVPRLPFGHLNPAWEIFKESLQDEDQLWSFSAPWESAWRSNEVRSGYVVLRGEVIGPYFLTGCVTLDETLLAD